MLVDTQCFLWMTSAPGRFSTVTRRLLQSQTTTLFFSAASAWEIAIKHGLGKLALPGQPSEYVEDRLRRTRTTPLPISVAHGLRVAELPPHHRDPFDRLLIAQAQLERLPVLTADRQFAAYDVEIVQP